MTVTTKRSLIALLLSLVLVVSLFTVGVSATDELTEATTGSVEESSATEAVDENDSASETASEADGSEQEAASEKETEKETETDGSAALIEQQNQKKKTLIINFAIIGVIILIAVILCIKFREKLGGFLRSVKSELKKIVWASKESTRKSFLIVIVVAVSIAILLGLMDLAFSTGINGLASLFK